MKPIRRGALAAPKAHVDVISWLLVTPLVDRAALEVLTGWSHSSVVRCVETLESLGHVASFQASVPGAATVRRLFLTASGIEVAAGLRGASADALLREHPISDHWIRLLIARLKVVTSIYRFVAALAEVASIRGFCWYRRLPLDAVVELDGGRMLAVLREGCLAPPSHLGRRLRSLLRLPHPATVAVLAPDELCLRDWQRLLERLPFSAFLALEDEVLTADSETGIWFVPSDRRPWSLGEVVPLVGRGDVPAEAPPRRRATPPSSTANNLQRFDGRKDSPIRDRILPAALDAGGKRVLDLLAVWPWMSFGDLQRSLCVSKARCLQLLSTPTSLGMVARVKLHGRVRYALSDRGLSYLSRQDRLALGMVIQRWSASAQEPGQSFSWRNIRGTRARQLAKDISHTAAIHGFTSAVASQIVETGGQLVEAQPAHRAVRRFVVGGQYISINPDAFLHLRIRNQDSFFFLEWERGVGSVAHFVDKLNPYLAYYWSRQPLGDFGAWPTVLFVFRDELVEADFVRVAHSRTTLVDGTPMPILVSTESSLKRRGPLYETWRMPRGNTRTGLR